MKSVKLDIQYLFGLFLASIIINYFFPKIFGYAWFFGLLFVFLKTKRENNYFWVIFFWLIFTSPGFLFNDRGMHPPPIIPVPGFGREIFFDEIVCIAMISKATLFPIKQKYDYDKPIKLLIIYALFLLLLGLITGMGLFTFLKSIRYFFPILLLPLIPRLIHYEMIPNTLFLMFVLPFILLSAQIVDIIGGNPLAFYLGESSIHFAGREIGADTAQVFDVTRKTVRTIYGPFIHLFSLVFSMALIVEKKRGFHTNFLYAVSLVAAISIFLSATRGWILGVVFIFAGFVVFQSKKAFNYILLSIVVGVLITAIPKINMQVNQVVERVSTLTSIVQGDLSAHGTLSRLTDRSPRVMNKFWERPFFGFGFSDEYYEYADGHVGNQTLLLNGGVFGYAVFLYFLFFFASRYVHAFMNQSNKAVLACLLGLMALIIIHSSSRMVFSYYLNVETAVSLSLFFFFSDYFLKNHHRYENNSY